MLTADILSLLEKLMNRFIIADANKCIGCRTPVKGLRGIPSDNQDCIADLKLLPRIHVISVNRSTATLLPPV